MSTTVSFELTDEVAMALGEISRKTGRPFDDLALEWLVKYRVLPAGERPLAERQAALDQLKRHAGAAKLGNPTGADNDAIDRDLAREMRIHRGVEFMLLDTSGLLCYFHRDESLHSTAVACLEGAGRPLTHSYVLAEFLPLCRARRVDFALALEFVGDLVDNAAVETYWVDEALHRAALHLLRRRPDKTYSLCDAVSFVLMRQLKIATALTTDRHFEQEGFTRLLGV